MRKKETRQHHMESLVVLLLFGVFAVCILSVLLTGAGVYRRLTERDTAAFERRTAAQYIAAKVRQADQRSGVSVGVFDGRDALVLTEEIDGVVYETRIYCHDGYLRELFAEAGTDLSAEDGQPVMEAQALHAAWDGRLLVELRDADGGWERMTLYPRSGEEALS